MCGIVGILSANNDLRSPELLSRMMENIVHRGPDDSGQYLSGPAALGFRRLSILDLQCGHQPMISGDSRYAITFNGEIYNFQEIRADLIENHQRNFSTRSDTEVILQAFQCWGADAFSRLNGMFAIAIWDNFEQKLYLARDRAGKKPLFIYATNSCLLYASEIKSFMAHPEFSARPDPQRIIAGLAYRYAPGAESLFECVDVLPAGHWAVVDPGSSFALTPKPFWANPACAPERQTTLSPADATAALRRLLAESVQRRMVADVPVGAFLSGGIDSSLIVALMAQATSQPLNTFSVGFDTGFSEHNYAKQVAEKFGTIHHETIVGADNLLDEIPATLWHRETPVSEPSDIPLYILAREARKHVTVVLSGEGSDELFGGYPKYAAEYYLSRFPASPLRRMIPGLAALLPGMKSSGSPIALALSALAEKDKFDSMSRWFGAFSAAERQNIIASALASHSPHIHDFARSIAKTAPGISRLTMMQLQDFSHWLPANLLLRGDRISMAHSLELRCPFLDRNLIDFAFGQLPGNYKIRNRQVKWIVRQIAKDLLPDEIINRKKWGFKVPVGEWFRGPLKKSLSDTLLSPHARDRGYFQISEIERLIAEHTEHGANHSKQLWYLFQLELWHLMFIDGILKPGDQLY